MKKLWKEKKKFYTLLGAVLLMIFVGGLVLFNKGIEQASLRPIGGTKFSSAVVEEVLESNIDESGQVEFQGNQKIRIKITSGKFKGQICEATCPYANHS